MAAPPVLILDERDPRLKLRLENRVRNVFVTQSEENRNVVEENVTLIPVVTETPGSVLEAGVNTLQRTIVLKKQAELSEVDKLLALKRQEFKSSLESLAQRRSELEIKHQETKEKAVRFERYVAENELKRRRALQSYEAARQQNLLKQREIEDLTEQLKKLHMRQQVLKDRVTKYKIYEDYLMKTLEYFPGTHLDHGSESLVMPIIHRHETLSITNQRLQKRLSWLETEVEKGQKQLHDMGQEHSMKKLISNKELSELQREFEALKEENKKAEANLLMVQGLSAEKVEEVGSLLLAINNLAEQCYIPTYGPLENMNQLTKLDMVKEYILDKADTEKRARRLMRSGSVMTSRTAGTDKRSSMKSFSSRTQIKSFSKVSRKSEMMG